MSRTEEALAELGVPNNISTRTVYRASHKLAYTTLYVGVTLGSVVTRKSRLELANSMLVKLGIDPVDPTK